MDVLYRLSYKGRFWNLKLTKRPHFVNTRATISAAPERSAKLIAQPLNPGTQPLVGQIGLVVFVQQ